MSVVFVEMSSNFHPYECDGTGKCIHCDRAKKRDHDPATCALCDPAYDHQPNRYRKADHPLHRIKGAETPRYVHPNGWRIVKQERTWSLRGGPRGALGNTEHTAPKRWYEVTPQSHRYRPGRSIEDFRTLSEARAWCDSHVWNHATESATDA